MIRIRNLDNNGDWTFGQSQINYVKDKQSIELDIQMRLKEWYKDCFFSLLKGIPWSTRLGYPKQKDLLDTDIKSTILSVEGVLYISNFESSQTVDYNVNYYVMLFLDSSFWQFNFL